MRSKFNLMCSAAALMLLVPASVFAEESDCWRTVPLPHEIVLQENAGPFGLDGQTVVVYDSGSDEMKRNAMFMAGYIQDVTGSEPRVAEADIAGEGVPVSGAVVLHLDRSSRIPAEGYSIDAGADGLYVTASSPEGIFHGIQTVRKAICAAAGFTAGMKTRAAVDRVLLPAVKISDAPEFWYRGAHFDVCRHFFPVSDVKEYIDMMALHNMNRLHWHITDDQGWRVEIDRYPELVAVGSVRDETLVGHLNDRPQVFDGTPYGGYYTKEEVRDIVEYAAERYITVVPEVDLPGHMQAALAAYPQLGCTGGPYKVWTKWGVSEDVLCAGNPEVYTFLDNVFEEIMELFPSEYIHIGGDECPKVRWESCPECQAMADSLGFVDDASSTREQKLQGHIMRHVASFLEEHGKKVIGWDEILEGGAADGATVMSWRGESGGIKAARLGHDVIMTPNSCMYFDFCQGQDASKEPLSIGGYIPVEAVYMYSPVPKELKGKARRHIIGVQANLWTEYISTFSHAQYMVLPRWAALAENQWNPSQRKDYKDFLDRLQYLIGIYDAEGWNYAAHVFDVTASILPDTASGAVMVSLETMGDAPVHYTLDGSVPDESSAEYSGAFAVRDDAVLKAAAFRAGAPGNILTEEISFSMSTACPVRLLSAPAYRYSFGGAAMLADGLKGDGVFGSGRWIGFEGEDMVAEVDLGKVRSVASVAVGICVNTADGVFDARGFEVSVSADGKKYRPVFAEEYPAMDQETRAVRRHFLPFPQTEARYVRVVAKAEKSIPVWSWLKGSRAFLFADEIEVGDMVPASSSAARFVGRVSESPEGYVKYDWAGTYFSVLLEGDRLDAEIACKGECWFNVIIDGEVTDKFCVKDADTVVTVFPAVEEACCGKLGGECRDVRHVMVQKCTEAEYGTAEIKGFILSPGSRLFPEREVPSRHIEFIGNSLTSGFGTEGGGPGRAVQSVH